jgi:Ca2+-binding RTX toxin-like protein
LTTFVLGAAAPRFSAGLGLPLYSDADVRVVGDSTHMSFEFRTIDLTMNVVGANLLDENLGSVTGLQYITGGQPVFTVDGFVIPYAQADDYVANPDAMLTLLAGGADSFQGSLDGDTIASQGGADTVIALDGNDTVDGGAGSDDVNGNKGDDRVLGGDGADWVRGGQGSDAVYGGLGDDVHVNGNLGDDTVHGDAGNDTVFGGQGDDWIYGDAGIDLIFGDLGNDTLVGGTGGDHFRFGNGAGGTGADKILDFSLGEGDRIELAAGTAYSIIGNHLLLADGSDIQVQASLTITDAFIIFV